MESAIRLINVEKKFENNKLFTEVNLDINKGSIVGFVDIYSGLKNLKFLADIRKVINEEKIINTMKIVGLDPKNKNRVKNYSLGMKQKLGIAQAIMENQDIIILDEPFNALDADSYEKIKSLIVELKRVGKTILLTSHNSEDLSSLCDVRYELINQRLVPIS